MRAYLLPNVAHVAAAMRIIEIKSATASMIVYSTRGMVRAIAVRGMRGRCPLRKIHVCNAKSHMHSIIIGQTSSELRNGCACTNTYPRTIIYLLRCRRPGGIVCSIEMHNGIDYIQLGRVDN